MAVNGVAFGGNAFWASLAASLRDLTKTIASLEAFVSSGTADTRSASAGQASTLSLGGPTSVPATSDPATSVPPTSEPPTSVPPAGSGKIFIVGDRKHFGGKYVKVGLQAMLDAADGKKAKGRTKGRLSPEDAEKLRAILGSKDPEVQKLLNSKVPNGKSLLIDESGKLIGTADTGKQVMTEQSLQMADHKGWDRSAGGTLSVDGKTYSVAGTELHSPIKIALDGQDARLNSSNGFAIDLDGFGQGQDAVKTSGGLNANEAWLVRDKDGDGLTRGGVVDGRDVYGDHEGKFGNGYEELARDFASELKTDPATGRRYLDLGDPNSRAARELKLLDASGNLVPAAQVVSRLDVDFADVRESDATGSNQIRQRAGVTYLDGRTATSADQWYRAS